MTGRVSPLQKLVFALCAALLLAVPASAQVTHRSMSGPAPFGILLGDVFTLRSRIEVAAPFKLDPASLPKSGAVTYSLDLRSLKVEESAAPAGGTRYDLTAEYQTFYAPLEAIEQTVPAFKLAFVDGSGKRVESETASWTYVTSPLRPIVGTAGGGGVYSLRPDAPPRPVSVRRQAIEAAAAGAAALVALALLAWSRAWPPFHARPARPFARASRAVAREAKTGEAGWRASALALHRAFDVAAGRRLLGDDIAQFLAARPAFSALQPKIEAFFAASRGAFFGDAKATDALPADQLTRLARDLAAAERAS